MEAGKYSAFSSLLFEELKSGESILPIIRKCFEFSNNEVEILKGIELGFGFCLQYLAETEVEHELFQYVCSTAKNMLTKKLQYLESLVKNSGAVLIDSENLRSGITKVCISVICSFQEVFNHLNSNCVIHALHIGSFLKSSAEVIHICFCHCETSEKIYGSHLSLIADCLTNLFKESCELLEKLLNCVNNKILFSDGNKEGKILDEVLTYLSKSGIVLMNLEVKTMARLWKSYTFIIQKHFDNLKCIHNIGDTIDLLCSKITFQAQKISSCENTQDILKSSKLACFILKIIIKLCEIYNGHLKSCHHSLSELLLFMLCRCNTILNCSLTLENCCTKDFVVQLSAGADPLLSQLICDEDFAKKCATLTHQLPLNTQKVVELLLFYCAILKKLIHSNKVTRNFWFNEEINVVEWVFYCASYVEFYDLSNFQTSKILVCGKMKKFTDIYEYVLVVTNAFLMTLPAVDFINAEKILLKYLLQPTLLTAILAIDTWCLLSRFAGSGFCLSAIRNLCCLIEELKGDCLRVEKCYLKCLIYRLLPLITESQKEALLAVCSSSLKIELWGKESLVTCRDDVESKKLFLFCVNAVVEEQIKQFLDKSKTVEVLDLNMDEFNGSKKIDKFENLVIKLWKFNCKVLLSYNKKRKYLKWICAITSYIVHEMKFKNIFLVLNQIKKVLILDPDTSCRIHFLWILGSLSPIQFPSNSYQQHIISAIAEIFNNILDTSDGLVKQKCLDTFYLFSHVTFNSEIIALTVRKSPNLKLEITNYFKQIPFDKPTFTVTKCFELLLEKKYQHFCHSNQCSKINFDKLSNAENIEENSTDVMDKWRQYSEKIVGCYDLLSESEKTDVKQFSSLLLSLP